MKAILTILILMRSLHVHVAFPGTILCKDANLEKKHVQKVNGFCKNGGTCYVKDEVDKQKWSESQLTKLLTCRCTAEWEGVMCETRKNQAEEEEEEVEEVEVFCKRNKCKNNGQCLITDDRSALTKRGLFDKYSTKQQQTFKLNKFWCACPDKKSNEAFEYVGHLCQDVKIADGTELITKYVFCKRNKCKNNGICLITRIAGTLRGLGLLDKYTSEQKRNFKNKKFWCACPDKNPNDNFEYAGKLCQDAKTAEGTVVKAAFATCSKACKKGTCKPNNEAVTSHGKEKLNKTFLAPLDDQYCICKPGYENSRQDPKCKGCKTGSYSQYGLSCLPCSEGCLKPRKCEKKTGRCKSCKEEWEGEKCDQKKQPTTVVRITMLLVVPSMNQTTRSNNISEIIQSDEVLEEMKELALDALGSLDTRITGEEWPSWWDPDGDEGEEDESKDRVHVSISLVSSRKRRRRDRSRRQAAGLRLQADFEIVLPASAAQETDLSSEISTAFKENSDKFKSDVLPGLKIDKQSITVSAVRISEIDDKEEGSTLTMGVFIVMGAAIAALLAVATVTMVVVRRNRNKQRQQMAYRNTALMYAMPQRWNTASNQYTGRSGASSYRTSRVFKSGSRVQ